MEVLTFYVAPTKQKLRSIYFRVHGDEEKTGPIFLHSRFSRGDAFYATPDAKPVAVVPKRVNR